MADPPVISTSGQGTRREAAQLGQSIGDGVTRALASRTGPLHIETLRVQLPAGSSRADIDRAIRIAVERRMRGGLA